jgi:hypothetical protein
MELGIYTFGVLTPDSSGGPTITARERLRNLIEERKGPTRWGPDRERS